MTGLLILKSFAIGLLVAFYIWLVAQFCKRFFQHMPKDWE